MCDLRPKLVPVEVPWLISPSTPWLRLTATEHEGVIVRFVGYFALEDPTPPERAERIAGFEEVRVVGTPYDHPNRLESHGGPYQLVRVTFARGLWARFCPAHSDGEMVDPDAYDFSTIPEFLKLTGGPGEPVDVAQYVRRFRSMWARTQLCPDPHMYEVENSTWVEHANAGQVFRHYMLWGHDAYVEILAEGWQWESEGSLEGWQSTGQRFRGHHI